VDKEGFGTQAGSSLSLSGRLGAWLETFREVKKLTWVVRGLQPGSHLKPRFPHQVVDTCWDSSDGGENESD